MDTSYPQFVNARKSTFGGLPLGLLFVKPCDMATEAQFIEIGRRIEAVRAAFTDLSQREFATRHSFNPTQWNNWATGTRRIPLECAEKLVNAYGLTLDWIYLGRRDGLADRASKVL
jgi:hypothetical protein